MPLQSIESTALLPWQFINSVDTTYDYSIKAPKTIDDNQDFQSLDITSHGGDLADALGNNIYNVDSWVVRGTVDAADIRTL